jgi:hypothetical protein
MVLELQKLHGGPVPRSHNQKLLCGEGHFGHHILLKVIHARLMMVHCQIQTENLVVKRMSEKQVSE